MLHCILPTGQPAGHSDCAMDVVRELAVRLGIWEKHFGAIDPLPSDEGWITSDLVGMPSWNHPYGLPGFYGGIELTILYFGRLKKSEKPKTLSKIKNNKVRVKDSSKVIKSKKVQLEKDKEQVKHKIR